MFEIDADFAAQAIDQPFGGDTIARSDDDELTMASRYSFRHLGFNGQVNARAGRVPNR